METDFTRTICNNWKRNKKT